MTVAYFFEAHELPRLLNATGLLPVYPPNTPETDIPRVDLSLVHQFDLKVCWSKEWHRFPGHYLVPDGIAVEFVKSEFNGLLPGHFMNLSSDSQTSSSGWSRPGTRYIPKGLNDLNQEDPAHYVSSSCRNSRIF
jgi:alpha-1,2-mannosyltransferase